MNNLEIILRKIREDADGQIREIEARANEEAAAIAAAAADRAEADAEAARARSEQECALLLSRASSAAAMRRREILLAAKVEKIEEAYRRAEESLYELDAAAYTELLAGLLSGAMLDRLRSVAALTALYGETESAETPSFEAVFNEHDKSSAGPSAVKKALARLKKEAPEYAGTALTVSADTAAIRGGVILRYGDIESNCSVQALIAAARSSGDADVVKTLFPA